MTLDVGIIGVGGIADAHFPAYRQFDELRVSGVCDVDESAANAAAEEFKTDRWTEFETFVAEADIDAVDVILPHALHYPAAKAALEAGLHVHVEKPFATSMDQARELVKVADERDLTLMVGQTQRYDPHNRALERRLADGELGEVHHARFDAVQNLREHVDTDHWLFDGEKAGGGGVISVLVHRLDLLRYFLGEPRRVTALAKTADPAFEDAEDYCVGLLEMENGAMVDVFDTYSAAGFPYGEGFWLFGEERVVHALPAEGEATTMPRISRSDAPREFDEIPADVELPSESGFVNELVHFANCVGTRAEPLSSGRDNIRTLATVFALYESVARDNEWVSVAEVLTGSGPQRRDS